MRQDRLDDGIIVGDRQAGLGPRSTEMDWSRCALCDLTHSLAYFARLRFRSFAICLLGR